MTYDEAMESRVSIKQALAELRGHGTHADYDQESVFDCVTGDDIAWIGKDGMVRGSDVLGWLGY